MATRDVPLPLRPDQVKNLSGQHPRSSWDFLNNARKYNSCFQITSFGSEDVKYSSTQGWMPIFWAYGQVYHKIGSMQPAAGQAPQFLQMYFMGDHRQQSDQQCSIQPGLNEELIFDLQEMLHETNAYANILRRLWRR